MSMNIKFRPILDNWHQENTWNYGNYSQPFFSDHFYKKAITCIMWLSYQFPFTVHFILIKPVLSNHLSYVTLFQRSFGRSHLTTLTLVSANNFSVTVVTILYDLTWYIDRVSAYNLFVTMVTIVYNLTWYIDKVSAYDLSVTVHTNRPPHNKFQSSFIDWIKRPRRNQSTTPHYINITF